MSKRKQKSTEEEGNDSDVSLVDIDFEFFDPNPEVDYLAIKRLATQLFAGDAESLQLHDFADLVLSQPEVGTSIKCDGKESDPYAFLTVLNMRIHQARPSIKALTEYILSKSSPDAHFHSALQNLLGPNSQDALGYVFSGRLINMPVPLVPPMYRMLEEELQWVVEENKPFRFSHYLFISQTYRLSPEEADELEARNPRSSKRHRPSTSVTGGVFSVFPEDEIIAKFATYSLDFSYTKVEPRDGEAFGLDTGGKMMLVPADKLSQFVQALGEAFPHTS